MLVLCLWRKSFRASATFVIGSALARTILRIGRFLPQNPRWLLIHGRIAEVERSVCAIEAAAGESLIPEARAGLSKIRLRVSPRLRPLDVTRILLTRSRAQVVLCLTLMESQPFFYNATFFTYELMSTHVYPVEPAVWAGICGRLRSVMSSAPVSSTTSMTRYSPQVPAFRPG